MLTDPPIMLLAHPGHELLLHGWLETEQPLVFHLSDGSGGAGSARTGYSGRTIEAAGALIHPEFGRIPDTRWYDAIRAVDTDLFAEVCNLLDEQCGAPRAIACDPLEFYNPLHDLANAMAHALAARIERRTGVRPPVLTYPIRHDCPGDASETVSLDAPARERKAGAIRAYKPLAAEAARYEAQWTLPEESLYRDNTFEWPDEPGQVVEYELIGRDRIRDGRYNELITYAGHVAPIARAMLGTACPTPLPA